MSDDSRETVSRLCGSVDATTDQSYSSDVTLTALQLVQMAFRVNVPLWRATVSSEISAYLNEIQTDIFQSFGSSQNTASATKADIKYFKFCGNQR